VRTAAPDVPYDTEEYGAETCGPYEWRAVEYNACHTVYPGFAATDDSGPSEETVGNVTDVHFT
jgi:hypothetical protein